MNFNLNGLPTPKECEEFQNSKEHIESITKELEEAFLEKYKGAIVPNNYKKVGSHEITIVFSLYFTKLKHTFNFLEFRKDMFKEFPVDVFLFKGQNSERSYMVLNSRKEITIAIERAIASDGVKKLILSNI